MAALSLSKSRCCAHGMSEYSQLRLRHAMLISRARRNGSMMCLVARSMANYSICACHTGNISKLPFCAQVSLIHGRNVDGVSCIQLAEWSQALQIRWLRTCSRAAVILRMANGPQVNGQRCGSTQHTLCHKQNTENIRHKSEQQWQVENKKNK